MARRYFNWTLAIVLVVAIVVFAGAVFALHRWQKSSRAEQALSPGEQAYEQKDWDRAADQLGRYLSVHGDNVAVLLKYADAQLKRRPVMRGHIQQAEGRYRAILRLDANNTEVTKELCKLYLSPLWLHPDEAELIASPYLQNHDDPEIQRMLALSLALQRKFQEAARMLEDLIAQHPEDVLAYELLGQLAAERPEDVNRPAADWFEEAVKANPHSAMAYVIRGWFHRLHGHFDRALADFEQAGKQDLSDADVRLRLTQELIKVRAFDRARGHLTALQAQMPADATLWQCWAAATIPGGSQEEKAKIAEAGLTALAADPWDFMSTATELFITAGQYERAQDCISQMRQKGLQPALIAFLEGLLASAQGELSKGVVSWQNTIAQGYKVHRYAGGLGAEVPIRRMLASSLTQLGDVQSAIVQLQSLISESLESPRGLENVMHAVEGRLELARLLRRTRDWAGVLDQAGEVLRVARNHPEAILLKSQAQIVLLAGSGDSPAGRTGDWQEIENRLMQLDETTKGSLQAKMLLVQTALRQGNFAEAAKRLKEVKDAHASDFRVHLLEAELLAVQDKPEQAVASLQDTAKQFPQEVEPVQTLALLLYRQKDAEQCESVVKEAIARMDQPGARRDLGLLLADLYRRWGREDELYRWLADLAGQFPNDIQIKRWLLTCPVITGDVQQAQALVDQIKSIEGETGWRWGYEQARVWINSDDFASKYAQAVRCLQQNLQTNPSDKASRLLLAAAHEKGGQMQLALKTYREALNHSPDSMDVIMQVVSALYRVGGENERKEADRILGEAKARQPHYPGIEQLELYGQNMRWRDQVQRGALGLAADTLQSLIRRDPNDVDANLSLAQVLMQQGKLDEAGVILDELRAKVPESISVAQVQIRLHMLRGNMQEALRLSDEIVQKHDDASTYVLRAWVYAGLRESDKAIADFDRAVAKAPGNAGIWMDRAAFCQSIGRRDDAIQGVRKALSMASETPSVFHRAIPLCLALGSQRVIREVEEALDKAGNAHPEDSDLKLFKAQFLLNKGNARAIEQGQRLLREIISTQPDFSKAWHLLGRLELGQGQLDRALGTALRGLSYNEHDKQLLLLRADAEAQQSPAVALPTLRSLAEVYPNDSDVEMRLAKALYRSGSREEARSMLETHVRSEPDNPIPPVTLIELLAGDERWTEVTEQTTKWLDRHPDDTGVISAVARLLIVSGTPEGLRISEDLLNAAVKRNPKSIPVIASLASLAQCAGRTQEIVAFNRRLLELDPNSVAAMNNLAWSLCEENGKYEEAMELAEKGLRVAPDYIDLIDTRGVVHYRLGHLAKAAEDFERCIGLYPPNARSLSSCHFHLARVYAKMGRKTQAQECLKKAMELPDGTSGQMTDTNDRTGGLSAADLAEAKLLLEQLQ